MQQQIIKNMETEIKTEAKPPSPQQTDGDNHLNLHNYSTDASVLPSFPVNLNPAFTISNLSIEPHSCAIAPIGASMNNHHDQITPTPEQFGDKHFSSESLSQEQLYSNPGSILHRQVTAGSEVLSD